MSIFPQTPGFGVARRSCRFCSRPAVHGDRCELHIDTDARLVEQPQRAGYSSTAYRQARRLALKRSGGFCEACGDPLPTRDDGKCIFEAHHINGDPTDNRLENILVCCQAKCHRGARRPSM